MSSHSDPACVVSINRYFRCSSREISTRVAAGTIHGNQKLLSYRSVLANSTSDQNTVRQMMKWKNEADLNII